MADLLMIGRRERSALMAQVRSSGNRSTEKRFATILKANGITGWRRQVKVLGIRVDFCFRIGWVVVFVDGCFWHGYGRCHHGRLPRENRGYWARKFRENRRRDLRQTERLRRAGWMVVRVWEHQLRDLNAGIVRMLLDLARTTQINPVYLRSTDAGGIQTAASLVAKAS